MSLKWSGGVVDSSILRKKEQAERKEELLVFGYSCKLFRDDEKALFIDQGKHLIPWMGDESLKIDRYDGRGALHDLSRFEAPPGGYDWHLDLTDAEKRVEILCDEERYRALHTDENEEEMYKEEELKRLHSMGGRYGQVGFNYGASTPTEEATSIEGTKVEDEEPFIASEQLQTLLSDDVILPETKKLNAIIEKTALFIAQQGVQMEIFLKAKQSGNTQFDFLSSECALHPYYKKLVDLLKSGRYQIGDNKNEDQQENEHVLHNDSYLHPSLAAPVVESAPSIPSIHYKPSADCDYTMLITKITGNSKLEEESQFEEPVLPLDDVPPPGTVPLELPRSPANVANHDDASRRAQIARGPVLYGRTVNEPQQIPLHQHIQQHLAPKVESVGSFTPKTASDSGSNSPIPTGKSLGLNLMHYYNSDSGSGSEDSETDSQEAVEEKEESVEVPPDEVQTVINTMASYVARNGDNFEDVVKAKNDPRFTFLETNHIYHPYYLKLKKQIRSGDEQEQRANEKKEEKEKRKNAKREKKTDEAEKKKKAIAPVSFSIKKLKEPEPILPKPALPYESSSDGEEEDSKKKEENGKKKEEEQKHSIPNVVIYKIETQKDSVESKTVADKEKERRISKEDREIRKISKEDRESRKISKEDRESRKISNEDGDGRRISKEDRDSRKISRKDRESRNISKEDGDRRISKEDRESKKISKEDLEKRNISKEKEEILDKKSETKPMEKIHETNNREPVKDNSEMGEIISIDDIDDEFIDLTDDHNELKDDVTSERRKRRAERKARAAAFLASIAGGNAPTDNTTSLASVLVKTLTKLEAKKEEEERKVLKKKKKKDHKHREENSEEYGRDDRSHRKSKKRRERSRSPVESPYRRQLEDDHSTKLKKHKKEKKHKSSTHRSDSKSKRERHRLESESEPKSKREKYSPESSKSKKDKNIDNPKSKEDSKILDGEFMKEKRDKYIDEKVESKKKAKKIDTEENITEENSNGSKTVQSLKLTAGESEYSEGECRSDGSDSSDR